ncbi:unnamed protein product [Rotaria sordida]|uniref:Uncharacterized protein n=1 Tax=Rotaria sordida TaxID=392033 RepID=A0A815RHD6_9BILA|nr:unnamed protein product [Rotaria sordida]
MGVFNEEFDILLQDNIFTNTLNLISRSSIDDNNISSIDDRIFDRFCIDILPKIHHNVKHLIIESMFMGRILLAGNYPNLTSLRLFNFGQHIALNYFTDESIFQHIFKYQITELILENNNNNNNCNRIEERILSKEYTENVYVAILTLFKNLKYLSIVGSSMINHPSLSICHLPSTTFISLILTKLCINVTSLDDCLYLLDGRLKQLTTFIVQIDYIDNNSSTIHNTNDLSNLKYFSLTCYDLTNEYDNRVIPLLRRMIYLEILTLYVRLEDRSTFVDGTHLHKEILMQMSQLHTFKFYISTQIQIDNSVHRLSDYDIQQTFTKIGYHQISCTVNYYCAFKAICHVFSLPFIFDRLEMITNRFPTIIFHHVTYLKVFDAIPFKYEFFIRISKAFPLLKHLTIVNLMSPLLNFDGYEADYIQSYSVIEFSYLITLNMIILDEYYIEQFLLDTKTDVPRLTELKLHYNSLKNVTENFTRDATRHNCANIKQLFFSNAFETIDSNIEPIYKFCFDNSNKHIHLTQQQLDRIPYLSTFLQNKDDFSTIQNQDSEYILKPPIDYTSFMLILHSITSEQPYLLFNELHEDENILDVLKLFNYLGVNLFPTPFFKGENLVSSDPMDNINELL